MYFKHNTANIQNIGKRLPNSLKFVITRVGTILFIAIFIGCILVFIPRRRLKEQKETIEDRLGELLSSKADQVEDGVEKVYEVVDNLRDELLRKQGYRARYKPMPKWPEAGKLLEDTNEKLHDEVLEKHVTTTKTSSSESTTTTSPSTSTTEKKTRKVYKDPNNPFAPFGYNVTVSDSIPIDRKLNDIRIQECKDKKYRDPSTYPKVSIVMSLYNEAWSTLLRTISSIMQTLHWNP